MFIRRPLDHRVLGSWIIVGATIPMMSFYGRPLQHFLSDSLKSTGMTLFMGGALVLVALAALGWIMRKRTANAKWHGLWLLAAFAVITVSLPNVTEWLHFILFGLFGGLATVIWRPAAAIVICLAVSAGDEWFQWLLPDRVGDPRDVLVNAASCLLGAAVALIGGEEK